MRYFPLILLSSVGFLSANPCVQFFIGGDIVKEYRKENEFVLDDTSQQVIYYKWDNKNICDYDALADDPLLVIRTKLGTPSEDYDIFHSWRNSTRFSHFAYPKTSTVSEEILPSKLDHLEEAAIRDAEIVFDYVPIEFSLPRSHSIWWQISDNSHFQNLVPNLNRQESGVDKVALDTLSQTFINPDQVYFFRYAANDGAGWGEWSPVVSFKALKPKTIVSPFFEADAPIKISWQAESNTRYWIFASNAIDFVPEIYDQKQLNGINKNGVRETSANHNLVAIVEGDEIAIDDSLCFYRIVAERKGVFSVPSPLVYVFSRTQIPQRTVLQPISNEPTVLVRKLFPADRAQTFASLVPTLMGAKENIKPPQASDQAWAAVQPWIMPLNHAARGPLDRIFSRTRALDNSQSLLDAGFTNSTPGDGSQTIVTLHNKVPHYVMKLYLDSQAGVSDWQSWVTRASGAEMARNAIKDHKYYPMLVAPYKWIYPLPAVPVADPAKEGKNFVLVVDKMPTLSKDESTLRWYKDMNRKQLQAIYTIIQELGLVKASDIANLPWEWDLRNVFVDFEQHHVWPTQVENLRQWLRPEMQAYFDELLSN